VQHADILNTMVLLLAARSLNFGVIYMQDIDHFTECSAGSDLFEIQNLLAGR